MLRLEVGVGSPADFGGDKRVPEILTKKRGLSLEMIRRLHRKLKVLLESLIGTAA
jgi:HTH-type transcriptional regulator/antitoxin HigA